MIADRGILENHHFEDRSFFYKTSKWILLGSFEGTKKDPKISKNRTALDSRRDSI